MVDWNDRRYANQPFNSHSLLYQLQSHKIPIYWFSNQKLEFKLHKTMVITIGVLFQNSNRHQNSHFNNRWKINNNSNMKLLCKLNIALCYLYGYFSHQQFGGKSFHHHSAHLVAERLEFEQVTSGGQLEYDHTTLCSSKAVSQHIYKPISHAKSAVNFATFSNFANFVFPPHHNSKSYTRCCVFLTTLACSVIYFLYHRNINTRTWKG